MEAIRKHNTAGTNQEHDVSKAVARSSGMHAKTSEDQGVQQIQLVGTDPTVLKVAEQSHQPDESTDASPVTAAKVSTTDETTIGDSTWSNPQVVDTVKSTVQVMTLDDPEEMRKKFDSLMDETLRPFERFRNDVQESLQPHRKETSKTLRKVNQQFDSLITEMQTILGQDRVETSSGHGTTDQTIEAIRGEILRAFTNARDETLASLEQHRIETVNNLKEIDNKFESVSSEVIEKFERVRDEMLKSPE